METPTLSPARSRCTGWSPDRPSRKLRGFCDRVASLPHTTTTGRPRFDPEIDEAFWAYQGRRGEVRRRRQIQRGGDIWSKEEHLERMRASGRFRFCRELVLHAPAAQARVGGPHRCLVGRAVEPPLRDSAVGHTVGRVSSSRLPASARARRRRRPRRGLRQRGDEGAHRRERASRLTGSSSAGPRRRSTASNDVAVVEAPEGRLCGYLSLDSEPPYSSVVRHRDRRRPLPSPGPRRGHRHRD